MLLLFFSVGAVESPSFTQTALPTGSLFSTSPTLVQQPRASKKIPPKIVSPVMMENDEITAAAPSTNAPTSSASIVNPPAPPVVAVAANKKQKAAEDKARRDAHLLWLIDNTTWQDADNFMVEDNILKQIIGFDPAVFSVDMLRKICGKLGFVSRKYTKIVCLETILKAFNDL
jgi:hypothetical protein